jgi:hypothetical protein
MIVFRPFQNHAKIAIKYGTDSSILFLNNNYLGKWSDTSLSRAYACSSRDRKEY